MREGNTPPIDADRIKGFASRDAANAWLLQNPELAAAGVHFTASDAQAIDFLLQINTTRRAFRGETQDPIETYSVPLQYAAQREIVRCAHTAMKQVLCLWIRSAMCSGETSRTHLPTHFERGCCSRRSLLALLTCKLNNIWLDMYGTSCLQAPCAA